MAGQKGAEENESSAEDERKCIAEGVRGEGERGATSNP
jgi:hypothetical protein